MGILLTDQEILVLSMGGMPLKDSVELLHKCIFLTLFTLTSAFVNALL